MLRDESLEEIRQQYDEKDQVLSAFGERVSAWTLYEDIFDDLDQEIPIVILNDDDTKHIRKMSVYDAVALGSCRNDVLIGGCTYIKGWISKKTAKDIHAFIIDFDNAYSGVLQNALQSGWKSGSGRQFAMPTYIVNSGTGLHLYFVLDEPIPNYHSMTANIDKLYRSLAEQQSQRVYAQKQIQWFGQDFRCGGGLNKYGWENTIYKVGQKWDADDLAKAVGLDMHFIRYGEKRHTKPKEKKHRRTHSEGWKTDPAFYRYALQHCHDLTKEGNRYMSMCALSAIAYKCGVDQAQLESDLLGLLPQYNKGATRIVKEKEVYSAMKMYNNKAVLTPRESLERWQGWEYKPIKRNGRKRKDHIRLMNFVRDELNGNTNWHGRKPKKEEVEQWQQNHPDGTKAQCHRDTGMSHHTIDKYWQQQSNGS